MQGNERMCRIILAAAAIVTAVLFIVVPYFTYTLMPGYVMVLDLPENYSMLDLFRADNSNFIFPLLILALGVYMAFRSLRSPFKKLPAEFIGNLAGTVLAVVIIFFIGAENLEIRPNLWIIVVLAVDIAAVVLAFIFQKKFAE